MDTRKAWFCWFWFVGYCGSRVKKEIEREKEREMFYRVCYIREFGGGRVGLVGGE